ncbi:helix-turn-helix transcriptional regulator [Pusillimonas sp. CC-YST705]|uniref:Helix-turn-helix transcriptional regulator n=2 Tax=Mesopusillimonas faecipullorum TaxID=2755040 RepID=A0ABS8CBQ0_9BURK|nr:helix-turn-helix transcriptional regulator [Mesopusillimonas faecipullorum]
MDMVEIRERDTHLVAYRERNVLLTDSTPFNWGFAHASLVREAPWNARLPAIPHIGIAFNLRSPTLVTRMMGDHDDTDAAWLHPHQFSVLPSDTEVHWHIDGKPDTLLLYVHRQVFDEVSATIFNTDPATIDLLPRLAYADPLLASLCLEFVQALNQPSLVYDTKYMQLVTTQFASCLIKNHSNLTLRALSCDTHPSGEKVERAKAFMKQNLGLNISLDAIADAAGMSTFHFIREFKSLNQVTPYQYLLKMRVDTARRLLRQQRYTLAEIALECGFSTQSHFTHVFKKMTGLTPKAYRLSH